jgi:hypothetical protein
MTEGEMKGQSWPIGSAPISIGTGHRCIIRVPQIGIDDIANEQARVWIREDHLVLHELRRLTAFGPSGGRWEFLNAGDTFAVGPYVFLFQLADQVASEGTSSETPAVPEVWPGQGTRPAVEQEPAPVAQSSPPELTPSVAMVDEQPSSQPDAPIAPARPAEVPEPVAAEPSVAAAEEPAVAISLPPMLESSPFAAAPAQSTPESGTSDVPNILRDHKPDETLPPAPSPESDVESGVPNILRDRPAEAPTEKTGEDAA